MQISRRRALAIGMAGFAITLTPIRGNAEIEELIARFTGGAPLVDGPLTLTAPAVAENGSAVSITVSCPGARSIRILAPANPNPQVCTFTFGPLSGSQTVSTRIRMVESMDLIALARMADDSFVQTTARVSVTLGGCVG